jgi:HD-like signal output (HDOD) protein
MAVSRLDFSGAHTRAVNAAKSVARVARVDSILTRLAMVSHNDELDSRMLEQVMNGDAVLSRKLPLAVAAYCADVQEPAPDSVSDAVSALGYPVVRKIIQLAGIVEVHKELAPRGMLNAGQLTKQAVAVGVASEYLALRSGLPGPMAFAAGLFANIGVPALAFCEPGYKTLSSLVAGETIQLHEAEQRSFGCTHGDSGYFLLTDFGFPDQVSVCAGGHCVQSHSNLVSIVSIGESFAHQMGHDGGFEIVPKNFDDGAFARVGGTQGDAGRLAAEITRWNSMAAKLLKS